MSSSKNSIDKEIEIEMEMVSVTETDRDKNNSNKKKKPKTSKMTIILTAFIILAAIFIFFGIKYIKENNKQEPVTKEQETTTQKVIIKEFTGLTQAKYISEITEYFTYGTSLCIEGALTSLNLNGADLENVESVSLVLKKAYTNEDGSVVEENIEEFPLYISKSEEAISYSSYDKINNGIGLESFDDGEYCMLLRIDYSDGITEYSTLECNSSSEQLSYYTVTKNGKNQRITLSFKKFENMPYVAFDVEEASLPEDVYDIVIDPGHGGNDPGAVNGDYNEAVLMLDYAMDLKKSLEEAGYKVKLTRDGTEDKNEMMAYTMYNENGRVNVAGASNAKICVSLHLNSNEVQLSKGGIQVYFTCRGNESFAEKLVESIVAASGTYTSPMLAFKVSDGVYTRAFSQSEVENARQGAISDGYEPYDVTTDTDYYFMIRELGGIATNAYVDGRNTRYGCNNYTNSRNGIESCIIELGFISVDEDLEHILNNKDKYVEGMTEGIINYFSVE